MFNGLWNSLLCLWNLVSGFIIEWARKIKSLLSHTTQLYRRLKQQLNEREAENIAINEGQLQKFG